MPALLRLRLARGPGLEPGLLPLLLVLVPGLVLVLVLESARHRQPDSQLSILLQELIIIFCSLIYLLESFKIKSSVTMLALYMKTTSFYLN